MINLQNVTDQLNINELIWTLSINQITDSISEDLTTL